MAVVAYRDRFNGRYPITLNEVRSDAGVLFGGEPTTAILDAAKVDPVDAVDPPAFDPSTHSLAEGAPIFQAGRWRQAWVVAPLPPPTDADVTAERDRRMDAGLVFAGRRFQSRAGDRENIAGAAQLALMAVMSDAQPGDLRWHGGETDFVWIAEDNGLVPMDAPTVISFARAAAARKQVLTLTARAIKDVAPVPLDFRSDAYWPA